MTSRSSCSFRIASRTVWWLTSYCARSSASLGSSVPTGYCPCSIARVTSSAMTEYRGLRDDGMVRSRLQPSIHHAHRLAVEEGADVLDHAAEIGAVVLDRYVAEVRRQHD